MSRLLRHLLILSLVGGLSLRVFGFSLVGPLATWMTPRLGYNLNAPFAGGPMELTEEYRMNVPTWYYGFTADFLFFFGTRGVAEVDKAFKILNDLPATPNINIDNYPFSVQRMNHRAAALGLYDLKSTALSLVLTEMGITDPTRFVYTLRSRWVIDNVVYYFIVRRNYDPVTWTRRGGNAGGHV